MAYTTEEQDFQSLMSKIRQYLPLIITFVAVGFATYAALEWWKGYQTRSLYAQYEQFQRISTLPSDKADVKENLVKEFVLEYPNKPLAALAVLNTADQLSQAGKYEQALELFTNLTADNELGIDLIAMNKAKLEMQLGKYNQAKQTLEQVQEGSWYISARQLAGDILYIDKQYQAALVEYQKAYDFIEATIAKQDSHANLEIVEGQKRLIQIRMNIMHSLLADAK